MIQTGQIFPGLSVITYTYILLDFFAHLQPFFFYSIHFHRNKKTIYLNFYVGKNRSHIFEI